MENAALQSFTINAATRSTWPPLARLRPPSCAAWRAQRLHANRIVWSEELELGPCVRSDEDLKANSMNFAVAGNEVNLVETLSAGRPSENLSCEKCKMVCGLVSPSQAFLTTHRFALFLLGFTFVDATCMCAFHSTKSKECNRHAECARSVPPCRPVAPTACAQ